MQATTTLLLTLTLWAAAAAAVQQPHAAVSQCSITIRGDSHGGSSVAAANIECAGPPVSMAVHQGLLAPFQPTFRGIELREDCSVAASSSGCLLNICGRDGLIVVQASIRGMRGVPNALCVIGNSAVVLQSSLIADNAARGMLVAGNATVTLNSSRIINNVASRKVGKAFNPAKGGGLAVVLGAKVTLVNSSCSGNVAAGPGGGVYMAGSAAMQLAHGSVLRDNVAINGSGGGVALFDNATLRLLGGATVQNNTSVEFDGGGIQAGDNASVVVAGGSAVSNNTAYAAAGGGVRLAGAAQLLLTGGSTISGNVALDGAGGGVFAIDGARVIVTDNSSVAHNTARRGAGGGILLGGSASLALNGGSSIKGNRAVNDSGGGLAAFQDARVRVYDVSIKQNGNTLFSGGGIFAGGNASVELGPGTVVSSNRILAGNTTGGGVAAAGNATLVLDGVVVTNNHAPGGAGVLAVGTSRVLISASRLVANIGHQFQGGGLFVTEHASVTVTGGTLIASNTALGAGGAAVARNGSLGGTVFRNNAVTEGIGGAIYGMDDASVRITDGVTFLGNSPGQLRNNTGDRRASEMYDVVAGDRTQLELDGTIVGDRGPMTKCSPAVYLATYLCGVGEYLVSGYCACCPQFTFSFTEHHRSRECEKCPEFALCSGGDVLLPQSGFWHSSPRSVQIHQCPLFTASCGPAGVCKAGFAKNMCGSCQAGYGMRQPLRCGKCAAPGRQLGLYVAAFCITVALVTLTVHLTYRDNLYPGSGLRASDMIKCLVTYLQYLVIIGSISAPWPEYLNSVFDAASFVFGAASGQIMSVDCLLPHYVNASAPSLAIQRQLVNVLAPFAVFFVVVLLLLVCGAAIKCCRGAGPSCRCQQRGRQQPHAVRHGMHLKLGRHWPIVAMVVVFYAYPTLVTTSLSFFACLNIDTPSGPYAEYALRNHSAGYWVYDGLTQECFSGWHKVWALGFGLPLTLVFCLLLPVTLFLFLRFVGTSRAADAGFRELYGFLFKNYRDDRVWWEPVWMLRTVLLSAVAVFHFVIRAFYSVMLLGVMFAGSVVLQAWARPYTERGLHVMQLAASSCLFVTSYCTLALFTVTGQQSPYAAASIAVSVLVIGLNAGFVVWSVYRIVAAAGVVAATAGAAAAVKIKVATLCAGNQARRPSV